MTKKPKGKSDLFWKKEWTYISGGIALAIFNTLILLLNGKPWGVTMSITFLSASLANYAGFSFFQWTFFKENAHYHICQKALFLDYNFIITIGFIAGVFISSITAQEFSWKVIRSKKQVFLALVGGLLMGYGARLASGCNVGAFIGGVSSLSVHGYIFAVFLFMGILIGVNFLIKYLYNGGK